jgi:hypothetical protein
LTQSRPDFQKLRVRGEYNNIPLSLQSMYLNAAYATLHDYTYEYYKADGAELGRNIAWCRILAVKKARNIVLVLV